MISHLNSIKIQWLSLIAAALVVFMHCPHNPIQAAITFGPCKLLVPFFFLVSGYFFANHLNEKGWYAKAIQSRVKSLLMPYLLWFGFYFLISVCITIAANIAHHAPPIRNLLNLVLDSRFLGLDLTDVPSCGIGPLWYVRNLMIYSVISFAFVPILKKSRSVALWALMALIGANVLVRYYFSPHDYSIVNIESLIFFISGIILHLYGFSFPRWLAYVLLPLGLAMGILKGLDVLTGWVAVWNNFLFIPFLMLGVWKLCPPLPAMPSWMMGFSFPIYVIHPLFLMLFNFAISRNHNLSRCVNVDNIGVTFAIWWGVVSMSFASWSLIRKIFPKTSKIMGGGR